MVFYKELILTVIIGSHIVYLTLLLTYSYMYMFYLFIILSSC